MMTKTRLLAFSTALVVASAVAVAQDSSDRSMEQYSCKDVMRETDANRQTAVAFLHGYYLGKSGSTKFNLDAMAKQTDAFLDRCLDNPKEKAMDAMMKAKQ
jgi:hypothetical protein